MHLNARKLSFMGLLLSICVVLIILSGVLEFNTLFLLAAASFCVGIAFRESDIRFAFGFYLAAFILGFLLAPNKLYCITFAAMGMYLLILEFSYDQLSAVKNQTRRRNLSWMIKYIVFNLMYIPAVLFLPKLFYAGDLNPQVLLILIVGGQGALFIYDMAYHYFQSYVWEKLRRRLN